MLNVKLDAFRASRRQSDVEHGSTNVTNVAGGLLRKLQSRHPA